MKLKGKIWAKIGVLGAIIAIVAISYVFIAKSQNGSILDQVNLGGSSDNFTPYPIEGWNSALITRPEYDSPDMPKDALVEAVNIDFDIKSSIAPRKGSNLLGTTATTTECPIKSMHTSKSITGRELLLASSCDDIEWWNDYADKWETLDDGYTSGKVFTYADGATSTDAEFYTYFTNGADGLRRFRVAFASIASNTSTAITLTADGDYDTASEFGFDNSGTVTINGTDYTYDSLNGLILQGMSGLPTFTANDGVIASVQSSGFTSAPTTAVALLIKDQRLYAAYKNNVYCSKIDSFMDFGFSSPRVGSEGEIVFYPEGGDITGLADTGDGIGVFKKNYIGSLSFEDYDSSLFDVADPGTIASGNDIGAINNKGIIQKDNTVLYVSDDIGLNLLSDKPTILTERIRPTAESYDFSDAATIIWQNKVLSAYRDTSSASFNNRILLYDALADRITEIRNWNASSFAVYNGNLYYGDSISKNIYQAFTDNYSDDGVSYITTAKTKWFNFDAPYSWKEIGHLFVEGWITQNTDIKFRINFDEGGKLSTKEVIIAGDGTYVQKDAPSGTFGLDPFGIKSFSVVSKTKSDTLKHFSAWINVNDVFDKKFRNIQFEIYTSGDNQNYRIMRIVPYIHMLDDNFFRDNNPNAYID